MKCPISYCPRATEWGLGRHAPTIVTLRDFVLLGVHSAVPLGNATCVLSTRGHFMMHGHQRAPRLPCVDERWADTGTQQAIQLVYQATAPPLQIVYQSLPLFSLTVLRRANAHAFSYFALDFACPRRSFRQPYDTNSAGTDVRWSSSSVFAASDA